MGEKNFHLCLSIYFHHQAHLQEQWYEYEDDNSLQSPRYEAVSYTHLDVYKRQVMEQSVVL